MLHRLWGLWARPVGIAQFHERERNEEMFTAAELKQLMGGAPNGDGGARDDGAQDEQGTTARRILEVACGSPPAETLDWLSSAFMAYLVGAGASTIEGCLGLAPERGQFTWATKLATMRRKLLLRAAFDTVAQQHEGESGWRTAGRLSEALSDFANIKLAAYRVRRPRHLSGLSAILFAYFEAGGESLTHRRIHDALKEVPESCSSRRWAATMPTSCSWGATLETMNWQQIEREWRESAALREEFSDDFQIFSAYKRAEAEGRFICIRDGQENRNLL
jgi:hypothetical protein